MTSIEEFFNKTKKKLEEEKGIIYDTHWKYEPPTWIDYLTSGDYITPVVLSPKQMESSVAILGTDPRKIFSPERVVALGVFVVGKGGGKDWLVSIIMCYVILVLLHLHNPQKFLDVDGTLDILNVAIKGEQGERVFFNYFKERIKDCKWFIDNFKIVEENKIINKPRNKSEGTIELTSGSAKFPNKIRCFSETSKNESWDGYNVIFFVLDEISGFTSEKQISNGWSIYKTANSSCISRRTKNFKGLGFVISYPRQEKNDIILDLYEMSKIEGNEFIYGMRCFAWHFKLESKYSGKKFTFSNPRINRALGLPEDKVFGIEVPIEYEDEFKTDPESSLTKYCALPPRASGNWIEYPDRIFASIDPNQIPLFYTQDYVITKEVEGVEYKFLAKKIISCNESNIDVRRNYRYVAWLDNAEVSCDAVIGIGRKETIKTKDEHGVDSVIDIVRVVDIISWTPDPKNNLPIDLENVEDFLTTIIPKYINLKEVGKDRWESALLHNKLIKKGINSIRYNLLGTQYEIAKYFFYLGAVRTFDEEKFVNKSKNELTGLEQMLSLVATANGVEKKTDLKKDKSDAYVGVINLLMGQEFSKKDRPKSQKVGLLGSPKLGVNSPYKQTEGYSPVPIQREVSNRDDISDKPKLGTPKLV
jgi:hypothetical protein